MMYKPKGQNIFGSMQLWQMLQISLQAYRSKNHPNMKNEHAEIEGVGNKEGNLVIFETALWAQGSWDASDKAATSVWAYYTSSDERM